MTRAEIRMDTALDGHVSLDGHAGNELVCAAISVLMGATLNVLGDAAENVIYESGKVEFDVHFADSLQLGAFNVLCEALEMLSENFSDRVGVTIETPDPVK